MMTQQLSSFCTKTREKSCPVAAVHSSIAEKSLSVEPQEDETYREVISEEEGSTYDTEQSRDSESIHSKVFLDDVVLGRGKYLNNWPGNLYYRQLLEASCEAYAACTTHQSKKAFTMEIVRQIRMNGRFLKPQGLDMFVEITDREARVKVGQDLRYQARSKARRFAADDRANDGRKLQERLCMQDSVHKRPQSRRLSRSNSTKDRMVPKTINVEMNDDMALISADPEDSPLGDKTLQRLSWLEGEGDMKAHDYEALCPTESFIDELRKQVNPDPLVFSAFVDQNMPYCIANPKQDLEISLKRISLESIHSASLSSDVLEPLIL